MVRGRTTSRGSLLKYEYANILGRCFCLSLSAHHHISPSYLVKCPIKIFSKKCLVHAVVFFNELWNGNCLSIKRSCLATRPCLATGIYNKATDFQEMTITNLEEGGVCVCRNIPETDVITAELQGSVSNYMPRNFELDVLIFKLSPCSLCSVFSFG